MDKLLKGGVVGGSAVRVAGAVLLDRADVDLRGSENLGPTDRRGEKMGVAEGDVGDGDLAGGGSGFAEVGSRVGDGDREVGEGGAADAAEEIDAEMQEDVYKRQP